MVLDPDPPSEGARLAWPKLTLNFSHHRPTVEKSAVVFPASSGMTYVLVFAASLTCSLEMRNPPSPRLDDLLPH